MRHFTIHSVGSRPRSTALRRLWDCIRKMRVEGLAGNEIAGLLRHAADELDETTMTQDGEVDPAA
jgi:hypothetical protein